MSTTTRRRMRRLTAAAATVLACGTGVAALAPAATADPVSDLQTYLTGDIKAHTYHCDWNGPQVQGIISAVRRSLTESYPTIAAMEARGYLPYADAPLTRLTSGIGHWLNPKYMEDGHIMDPARPEGILIDEWNRPIGVMFVEDSPTTPGPDLYTAEDGTPCNGWHYHKEVAADAFWYAYKYGYKTVDTVESGNVAPEDRTPDLMHVWIYGKPENTFNHGAPASSERPGDPASAQEALDDQGAPRLPVIPPGF